MKNRITDNYWLFTTPITHRGLYDNENPENTLIAYELSIQNGYAIELDVQMSSDDVLVCYHDDNLKRVCGVDKDIREITYEEIKTLHPNGTKHVISTFKEVLDFIGGRVPLCIELKTQKRPGLEEKVVELLKEYKGEFVVQSFNPLMVRKVIKLAPEFITGVLVTREPSKLAGKFVNFAMHKLWFKYFVNFDFINMRIQDLAYYGKKLKKYNAICWTAKTNEDIKIAEKFAKNVIFEKTVTTLGKFKK